MYRQTKGLTRFVHNFISPRGFEAAGLGQAGFAEEGGVFEDLALADRRFCGEDHTHMPCTNTPSAM